jgi:hypothetical protein
LRAQHPSQTERLYVHWGRHIRPAPCVRASHERVLQMGMTGRSEFSHCSSTSTAWRGGVCSVEGEVERDQSSRPCFESGPTTASPCNFNPPSTSIPVFNTNMHPPLAMLILDLALPSPRAVDLACFSPTKCGTQKPSNSDAGLVDL